MFSTVTAIAFLAASAASNGAKQLQPLSMLLQTSTNTTSPSRIKLRLVTFTLKNRTSTSMSLVIGGKVVQLEPNEELEVKLAEGTDVLADDRVTVKVHVTRELGGNVVSFR